MITCPSCQEENADKANFCSNCGGRLAATKAQPPITIVYDPQRLKSTSSSTQAADPIRPEILYRHVAFQIRGVTVPLILPARAEYLIGRSGGNDIVPDVNLEDYNGQMLGVSRRHAILRILHQKLSITDLGSSNGTSVNGRPVAAHQPTPVESGDELRFGKLYVKVYFNFDAEPAEQND